MGKLVIHIVSDHKPGHLSQSRGLADAIARRVEVAVVEHDAPLTPGKFNSDPDRQGLILAAGRKASKDAIRLKQQLRMPAIVLMNPGWWLRRQFDLCVIPKHDGITQAGNVIVTEGALNSMQRSTSASLDQRLILIGGPSKHHDWSADGIHEQLQSLLERTPDLVWTATDSRRTPQRTSDNLQALAERSGGRLTYVPASHTPRGWVGEQLTRCGVCWVTEDSVSMIYEAMTAGDRVGLLQVPKKPGKVGRVTRGVMSLIERGWVGTFERWVGGAELPDDRPPLAEADRVASLIIERWLKA